MKKVTQQQALLTIWGNMPKGKFRLSNLESAVKAFLRTHGKYTSGSGLTALMRKLRANTHIDFDYSVINGKASLYKKL